MRRTSHESNTVAQHRAERKKHVQLKPEAGAFPISDLVTCGYAKTDVGMEVRGTKFLRLPYSSPSQKWIRTKGMMIL